MIGPLDRQIAELKGLTLHPDGPYIGGIKSDGTKHVEPAWSTSDSKALELMCELRALGFEVEIHLPPNGRLRIESDGMLFEDRREPGAKTPQEMRDSMCHGYIAAVTWMREKKG